MRPIGCYRPPSCIRVRVRGRDVEEGGSRGLEKTNLKRDFDSEVTV